MKHPPKDKNTRLSISTVLLLMLLQLWCFNKSLAQAAPKIDRDSLMSIATTKLTTDDSLNVDSTRRGDSVITVADKEKAWGIKFADDALPAAVSSTADDSAVLDIGQKIFYLYGNATAGYQDIKVTSGQLIYHQSDNI